MAKSQDEMDEQPASVIATLPSGDKYDLNNMPGKLRQKLILSGDADVNTFQNDGDNIPGSKRAKLIAAREEAETAIYAEANKDAGPNPYKKGDVVKYKNHISEVLASDEVKGVKITLKNGERSKWIHHSNVKNPEDSTEE